MAKEQNIKKYLFVMQDSLDGYVAKIPGKGLSTEDFTTQLKNKLDSISNTANNVKIEFTSSDSENVSWNGNVATFTHGLNCCPIVTIYDNTMTQALYGVKVLNGNQVQVDFTNKNVINGTYTMIVIHGIEFTNNLIPSNNEEDESNSESSSSEEPIEPEESSSDIQNE